MRNLEEAIRKRAYHLWIADGRPNGNADTYWLNAQREILTTSPEGLGSETEFSAAVDSASSMTKRDKKEHVARSRKGKRRAA
jgi:Protein of unknown function (DUF2934)